MSIPLAPSLHILLSGLIAGLQLSLAGTLQECGEGENDHADCDGETQDVLDNYITGTGPRNQSSHELRNDDVSYQTSRYPAVSDRLGLSHHPLGMRGI